MNSKILTTVLLTLCLSACTSTRILPYPKNIGKSPYGAVAIVRTLHNPRLAIGELITGDSSRLYLLDHHAPQLIILERSEIISYRLRVARTTNMLWAPFVFSSVSVVHGYLAQLTFPVNLLATIYLTQTGYTVKSSGTPYDELYKFARFPQGLSEEQLQTLNIPFRMHH